MTNQEKIIKIQEVIGEGLDANETVKVIAKICNFRESGEIKVYFRTLDDIEKEVCEYFNVTPEYFNIKSRRREIIQVRQFAHYKSIMFTNCSPESIGFRFGRKDRGTVNWSFDRILGYLQTNRKFREQHEEFLRS